MANRDLAPVPQAVFADTGDPRLIEALLLGSSFEGGWGPSYGVGDSGHSYGPYQFNLPYHPDLLDFARKINPGITSLEQAATDPDIATRYAIDQLGYGQTVKGVSTIYPAPSEADWQSNPELAAEMAAAAAERPQVPYLQNYGQGTLDQHWAQVLAVMAGNPNPNGQPNVSGTGNNSLGTAQAGGAQGATTANATLVDFPGIGIVTGAWHDIINYVEGVGHALSEVDKLASFMLHVLENLPQFMIRGAEIILGWTMITSSVGIVSLILLAGTNAGTAVGATLSFLPGGQVWSQLASRVGSHSPYNGRSPQPVVPARSRRSTPRTAPRPAQGGNDRRVFVQEQGRNYRAESSNYREYLRGYQRWLDDRDLSARADEGWRAYQQGREHGRSEVAAEVPF